VNGEFNAFKTSLSWNLISDSHRRPRTSTLLVTSISWKQSHWWAAVKGWT